MLEALKGKPIKDWAVPSGIIQVEVDAISGMVSHDGWLSRKEYFIKGTEPVGPDVIHAKLKICRGENKLASATQVAKGDYEEKEFIVLKADDPAGGDRNRWQEGIDAWINSQTDERYKYPREYCGETNDVVVQIEAPEDHQKVGNDFDFKAKVTANKEIDRVEFYVDGVKKKTINSKPYEYSQHLDTGTYALKVRGYDKDGNSGEREIRIGVNVDWDWSPTPSPIPSPSQSPSPSASPSVSPIPSP